MGHQINTKLRYPVLDISLFLVICIHEFFDRYLFIFVDVNLSEYVDSKLSIDLAIRLLYQKPFQLLNWQYSILVGINLEEFLLKLADNPLVLSLPAQVIFEYGIFVFLSEHHTVGELVDVVLGVWKLQLLLVQRWWIDWGCTFSSILLSWLYM